MLITLSPNETITVQFQDTDGEIVVGFEENRLFVQASMADLHGRDGIIYEERFNEDLTSNKEQEIDVSTKLALVATPLGEVDIIRFYGGDKAGLSIQLTQAIRDRSYDPGVKDSHHYIQVPMEDLQTIAGIAHADDNLRYTGDFATWLVKYIAAHPQVKDIKFQDGIMCLTLSDGTKVDMSEPRRIN